MWLRFLFPACFNNLAAVLQAELDVLRSMVAPADLEKASRLAFEGTAPRRADGVSMKPDLSEDIEADMSEKVRKLAVSQGVHQVVEPL